MQDPTQLPVDYMPDWVRTIIALALGAGGVQFFRVWLENRRLASAGFRELLLDRIKGLEDDVARCQRKIADLRVEVAHLEEENTRLQEEKE
jgi:hypothetical protein